MHQLARVVGAQLRSDLRARSFGRRPRVAGSITIEDLRELARRRTPRAIFDFVDGGADDELTLSANQGDLSATPFAPRVLVDVGRIDPATTVLGERIAYPVMGSPTGLTGLAHADGERAIAAAVHRAGSIYVLSAMASYTLEEVRAATGGPLWFQIYLWRDRGLVRELVQRAASVGCKALVVTVDVPRAGHRRRDTRSGFGIPPRLTARTTLDAVLHPRWTTRTLLNPRMDIAHVASSGRDHGAASLAAYINEQFDPAATWSDLDWLRDVWGGPLVIKGVLRSDDARAAVQRGATGIIVSNHGGRQLDQALSSIRALPPIVDAVGDGAEVYLDGGVRRGSDVVKALALGAQACLVGRPLVYGLAAGGEHGVSRALEILADETERAMTLTGASAVEHVGPWLLAEPEASPRA